MGAEEWVLLVEVCFGGGSWAGGRWGGPGMVGVMVGVMVVGIGFAVGAGCDGSVGCAVSRIVGYNRAGFWGNALTASVDIGRLIC